MITRITFFPSLLLIAFISISCASNKEEFKQEIKQTEADFAKMASEKGLAEAFSYFAHDEAVLNRSNKLIQGKDDIRKYFNNSKLTEVKLTWEPDFIDVSISGDMGYTYGKYNFSAKDSAGNLIESEGIFHTVWKKDLKGNWRFVWD